jgi:SH3 domain-containing protein
MRRSLSPLAACLAVLLATSACRKSEVETPPPERVPQSPDSTVVARIDASLLSAPSVSADPVGTVLEGDLLGVLAESGDYAKVNVRATGTTGWIESNLCLRLPPNPYWEGDTSRAREAARRIYQDKFLVQRDEAGHVRFPVSKVRVETAFNTVTFLTEAGQPRPVLPRKAAEELGLYWLGRVAEMFPEWREPTVYVKGFDGQSDYLMTLGPDKKPYFL